MASRHSNDTHIPTQQELERRAERTEEENQEKIAERFKVQDGKFLGLIPVPPELERTFGLIINPLIAGIAGHAGKFAHKTTTKLLSTNLLKDLTKDPEHVARIAQTGATGFVIAMDTILSAYALTKERATTYLHVMRDTKQIADEIGADSTNKMLNLAYKKYHASWGTDIKKLIPSVVQLVSTLPYAAEKYKEIWPESTLFSGKVTDRAASIDDSTKKTTAAQVKARVLKEAEEKKWSDHLIRYHMDVELEKHGFHTSSNRSHGQHGHTHGQFDITDLLTQHWTVAAPSFAGFIAPDIRHWATKEDKRKSEQLNSLEMVEALNERVKSGSTSRVHDAVVGIFEQFEKDLGHKPLSNPQLADRIKPIVDAIVSGKMGVRGLIRLVGEDMVIRHAGSDRELKSEEEIAKAVELVSAATLSKDSEISEDKFLGRFDKRSVIEDTIRSNLQHFQGLERDFFVSLMPLEILEHSGLSKKEIREARTRAQEHVYDNVQAAVLHLAMQDEKYLEEHGLTFKEVQYLKAVASKVMQGDMKTLHELVDNKKEGLMGLVAAGLLAEQSDKVAGDQNTWATRVEKGKCLDKLIDEAKEKLTKKHAHAPEEREHMPRRGRRDADEAMMNPRTHREHAMRGHEGHEFGQRL